MYQMNIKNKETRAWAMPMPSSETLGEDRREICGGVC